MGRRREAGLFLPFVAIVLVGTALFVALSYRNGVAALLDQRREEAEGLFRRVAEALQQDGATEDSLRRIRALTGLHGAALMDASGVARALAGVEPQGLLAPVDGAHGLVVRGPDSTVGDVVAVAGGLGPEPTAGPTLRVDLDAAGLRAQQRRSTLLLVVAVLEGLALIGLMARFARHLFGPIDALLERARGLGTDDGEQHDAADEDEIEALLTRFDRAMGELAERRGDDGEDVDLAAVERVLRGGLESGLVVVDAAGAVVAANETATRLLGIAAVDAEAPRPLEECLANQPAFRALLERARRRREPIRRARCRLEPEDEGPVVGLTVSPLRRGDGTLRGWLALFTDLTEAEEEARQLRLSETLQRLAELTGGLAHEMRNSLATIRGYLRLLERGAEPSQSADLQEIDREAAHLQRIVDDLLTFARPGSTRMESVELERLVHHAAADPALAGAAIRIDAEPGLPSVRGDAQLLERALRNLLHNAVEAQRAAGVADPIRVDIACRGSRPEIVIEDRGNGIPEDLTDRLFTPFASARPEGVGLGLALSRRIAGLHDAELVVENHEGGARAVLRFPPMAEM